MTFAEQLRLVKSSKMVHKNWYLKSFPEVEQLGIEPAEHYLRLGANIGRNPGKSFDTQFYLQTYPDAASSGLNPLVHYMLHGQAKGYATRPAKVKGSDQVSTVRTKLLSLGFSEQPLRDLTNIQQNAEKPEIRALAGRELALWHMRAKSPDGYRTALLHLAAARAQGPDLDFRRKLATAELLCHYFLGGVAGANDCYERAALAGEVTPDLILASTNLKTTPQCRVAQMNRVLGHFNIPPIALLNEESLLPYDRLTSASPLPAVTDGPKVTVLIAAYEAETTLPTALRSLQEQTWQNLEILVLDDCSPTPGTCRVAEKFAARDPRIRLIRMEKNGGAYVARNRGLDEATGSYVTLHDADDWSHPLKIETQIRFMESRPELMGSTTQQARAMSDLSFTRWTGNGQFIITNTSSFMFRRTPIIERLGYWDTVRFGADMELIRRIKAVWGKECIQPMPGSILSFQRDSHTSVVADEALGASTLPFGVRRQYVESQLEHHHNSTNLKYSGDPEHRPFPVPKSMILSKPALLKPQHYDVIIASDFRMLGGSTVSSSQEIICQKKFNLRTAIFPLFRYDFSRFTRPILPEVWDQIDGENTDVLAYGQKATCDLLIVRYPPTLQHRQSFIPTVEAKHVKVIVNQPPMSDYGPDGILRYDLKSCAANVRHYFGKDATWHPIGPLVRDALHKHHSDELNNIDLSDVDWSNIIDVTGWDRGAQERRPTNILRIGRHSRDHEHKWPGSAEDIEAAYPESGDVEIHVLGGASVPARLMGKLPRNWTVHDFGALHPRDFLKEIDIWIYFSHPDWLESFGRTIIEAMASGVPVILPEDYRPLFQEAALYATPQTAIKIARELYNDASAYDAQVKCAQAYVRKNFSYEMHIERIKALSMTSPQKSSEVFASPATRVSSEIPSSSGKTSAGQLSDLPRLDLIRGQRPTVAAPALLECQSGGHRFDYLWSPKPGATRLFVLFSGDAQRKKNAPPVFQRWSWAKNFPGHCLYVSDPMLHMHSDLGLAWYAGTANFDPMDVIIRRVQALLPTVGLAPKDVCAYGSSGGGFAALRMASMFPEISAIAINPQVNIANYSRSSPDRYARICLSRADRHVALVDFPQRMDLTQHVERLRQRNIILIQNTMDTHHYHDHYKPFCAAMGAPAGQNLTEGTFRRILFEHEGGHTKAETPEVFSAAMAIIESEFSNEVLLKGDVE